MPIDRLAIDKLVRFRRVFTPVQEHLHPKPYKTSSMTTMVGAIMVGEATALSAALPLAGAGGIVGGAVGGVCGSVVGGGVGVLTQDKEVGQLTGAVVGGVTGGVAGGVTGNFMVPGGFGAVVGGCAGAGTGATAGAKGANMVYDALGKKKY